MTHIQQRRDPAATWASVNPVLMDGEFGHETDTGRSKMGDGVTAWADLPYRNGVQSVSGKTGLVDLDVDDVAGAAPLADPVFTGNPSAPTRNPADDSDHIATTAFVKDQQYAHLDSPVFTGNPTAPTPDVADSDTSIATTAFVKAIMLRMNPVGTIYHSTEPTDPATFIGGTWEKYGQGRVLVGLDPADAEFDSVGEMRGVKSVTLTAAQSGVPAHDHGIADPGHVHDQSIDATYNPAGNGVAGRYATNNTGQNVVASGVGTGLSYTNIDILPNAAADAAEPHTNIQPSIVVYRWRRTA